MAIFSQQEIERRRKFLTAEMQKDGIACAFVWSPWGVYYITGMIVMDQWGRPEAAVLRDDGMCSLVVPAGEHINAEANAWVSEVIPYGDSNNVFASVRDITSSILGRMEVRGKKLAVERSVAPHRIVTELCSEIGSLEPADFDPLLAEARIVKSSEELDLLRIGGEAAKVGMRVSLESLTEGCTEAHIAAAGQAAMHRFIGKRAPTLISSSFAYCNSGLNTLTPHLHPTGREIQRGDIVALNVFAVVAGYLVELERTVVFGTCSPEQERALRVTEQAFRAGKRAVAEGVRPCDIHQVTWNVRSENGYGEYTRGGTGHSHGILIATMGREELGEIRSYNTTPLRRGMVISIEPGIYIPKVGAYRHSDVLVVTQRGSENLTEFEAPMTVV